MSTITRLNLDALTDCLRQAHAEGRSFLYEYEVYRFLADIGAETPPKCSLIERGMVPSDEEIMAIPGDRAVLKIVSPTILHKTEVGGVRIVDKEPNKVRASVRRMLYEVPENYAAWIERHPEAAPEPYRGLAGDALVAAISADLKGVLQVQFMPPDSEAFGNELIVGVRWTREFGAVISAGLGGTDTELYAKRFRKGQAIVAASVEMTDGQQFFELFKKTISYHKLAGLTRGQRRMVSDEQLIECFSAFIEVARHFSPFNPDAPFVITELEVNPFAFTDYLMLPLDGLCKFSLPHSAPVSRPVEKIRSLVEPERIGIIGVSATRMNFGRIILNSILGSGYPARDLLVVKPGSETIDGVRCVPDLKSLDGPLDLFIVAVAAPQVPDLVDEILESGRVNSVMLIPGGMGETEESLGRAREVTEKIRRAHEAKTGPVFLGGNSMGVVSHPGNYDSWFIPENKISKPEGAYRPTAFVSQSGAFMASCMAQCPDMNPAYLLSMGNQTDLTIGDMAQYFKDCADVDVIAIYAEGFQDLDGLAFCRAVREAVTAGKEVVFYKAGRTPEGRSATAGHTASLAGDYMVCESCVRQAGAVVARNFGEFENLVLLAQMLHGKRIRGNRLAGISSAGYEAVGMADSIHSDDFEMRLACLGEASVEKLNRLFAAKRLSALVNVRNPLDINPAADDETFVEASRALCEDPGVDAVIVSILPMGPGLSVNLENQDAPVAEGSLVNRMTQLFRETETPLICSVKSGPGYERFIKAMSDGGIPVFPSVDTAVTALSQYIESRLNAARVQGSSGL